MKKARDEMILSNMGLVYSLVSRVMRYASPSLSREDMVQIGCLALVEASLDYDSQQNTKFSTYAFTRIRWALLDELKGRRFNIQNIDMDSEISEQDNRDPQFVAERDELSILVNQAMFQLSKKQYDAVKMYYFEGLNTQQIADMNNVTLSYISMLIRTAIIKLRHQADNNQLASGACV